MIQRLNAVSPQRQQNVAFKRLVVEEKAYPYIVANLPGISGFRQGDDFKLHKGLIQGFRDELSVFAGLLHKEPKTRGTDLVLTEHREFFQGLGRPALVLKRSSQIVSKPELLPCLEEANTWAQISKEESKHRLSIVVEAAKNMVGNHIDLLKGGAEYKKYEPYSYHDLFRDVFGRG